MSHTTFDHVTRNHVAALAVALLAVAPVATAEAHDTVDKAARGAAGLTLGVLEIPGNVVEVSREDGVLSGMTVGLAQGLGRFVTRTLVGATQLLSAPFERPAALETAFEHDYPWQYFGTGESGVLALQEKELGWIRGISVERRRGALFVSFPSDLLFDVGSASLSGASQPRLQGLAETLVRHPETYVIVQGHTDSTGTPALNERLSQARAETVRSFLSARGVEDARIETMGFGAGAPVASNETPDGRRSNRRVEFVLRADQVAAGT